ncbi:MAG: bifunctional NADH-specific enoyl-ACP reductase/trans-2-enoyl-CoA reductase, partial [Pseudomonadales bacterium]
IRERLSTLNGDARVSVLKAVVTQASSAIPVMPLYLALLFKVMKAEGTHEGCIEQVYGLLKESLYGAEPYSDDEGRLRADRKELAAHVQKEVEDNWPQVTSENLMTISDFAGYQREFMNLFGFEVDGVDYDAEVDPNVKIANCL